MNRRVNNSWNQEYQNGRKKKCMYTNYTILVYVWTTWESPIEERSQTKSSSWFCEEKEQRKGKLNFDKEGKGAEGKKKSNIQLLVLLRLSIEFILSFSFCILLHFTIQEQLYEGESKNNLWVPRQAGRRTHQLLLFMYT